MGFLNDILGLRNQATPPKYSLGGISQVQPSASDVLGGLLQGQGAMGANDDIVVNGTRFQEPSLAQGGLQQAPPMQISPPPIQRPPRVREQLDFDEEFGSEFAPPEKGERGGRKLSFLEKLGDAFLVQSGNKPVRAERLRRENMADAMQGFSRDPVAAVERLNRLGEAEMAQAVYDKYVTQNVSQEKLRQAEREFTEQAPDREAKRGHTTEMMRKAIIDRTGRAISLADSQEKWTAMLPDLQQTLYTAGLDEIADNLPEVWSQEIWQKFLTPDGQLRLDTAEQSSSDRIRGQDVSSSTTRRGQDIRASSDAANRQVRQSEGAANRASQEKRAATRGSSNRRPLSQVRGAGATPAPKGKMVFRNGRLVPTNQ